MNLSARLMQLEETQKIVKKQLSHEVSSLVQKYAGENDVYFKIDRSYVYLYGSLKDPNTKRILHEEIDSLMGVRGINNEIRIRRR
ncbi:MAG: hypothetical protein WDA09_01145 [Bacteriovoracaceae bacterium]